jgi:hypothetical protein
MASRDQILEEKFTISRSIDAMEHKIAMLKMDSEISKKDLELQLLRLFREQRVLDKELNTALF